tara:strand:- start:48 stop:341 length:294 start_codon:yes stop_codon:yes gene_type:complete
MKKSHRQAISRGMLRNKAERDRASAVLSQLTTSSLDKQAALPPSKKKEATITFPANAHRIQRIVELGTMVDEMFPKTKISQIRTILCSVKRIVERGV